jgi:hypothetical protein
MKTEYGDFKGDCLVDERDEAWFPAAIRAASVNERACLKFEVDLQSAALDRSMTVAVLNPIRAASVNERSSPATEADRFPDVHGDRPTERLVPAVRAPLPILDYDGDCDVDEVEFHLFDQRLKTHYQTRRCTGRSTPLYPPLTRGELEGGRQPG